MYCCFVDLLHDLRIMSLVHRGTPFALSASLIWENTQGSTSLLDVEVDACVAGKGSLVHFAPCNIVPQLVLEGLATNFVLATEELSKLLTCRLPPLFVEFVVVS